MQSISQLCCITPRPAPISNVNVPVNEFEFLVRLKCLGNLKHFSYAYLNGNFSENDAVTLSPETPPPMFLGTYWQPEIFPDGNYAFRCMASIYNNKYVYLDGNTYKGTIELAPSYSNSGTRWKIENIRKGVIALKCLGSHRDSNYVYLDGHTVNGQVNFAPQTDGYTGTQWEVVPLDDFFPLNFKSLGSHKDDRHVYLDGLTQTGMVTLSPKKSSSYTGTYWLPKRVSSGIYTLRCMGHIHQDQYVYLSGSTAQSTTALAPDYASSEFETHWKIENTNGAVNLQLLQTDIYNPKWLNGITQSGIVNLSSTTDGSYTGTHWEVQASPPVSGV